MAYATVLLDADDTLLDYRTCERSALERCLVEQQLPFEAERDIPLYSEINRALWRELENGALEPAELGVRRFETFCRRRGFAADPDVLSRRYLDHLAGTGMLIPGARDVLERLHNRTRLVLITNGFSRVQRGRIRAAGIVAFFEFIAISEELGAQKPDPVIFARVFEHLPGAERGSSLVVGDSLTSDIAGGNAFGIDTCWFNRGGEQERGDTPVTYEIHALSQLIPIVLG